MTEQTSAATPDSSIPPFVPAEAAGDVRAVLRTPWARRWALIVMLLMLAWTAAAWELNARHYRQRLDGIVQSASTQALASEVLVEDGLRQGLAQLDGVAHVLARLPAVRRGVVAAGPGASLVDDPVPALRGTLRAQPELAAVNDFLAASYQDLGADLIYLLDDAGNCVASSDAGSADSVIGQHLTDPSFFRQTQLEHGARLFAVGKATGIPGMYFSAPIFDGNRFLGAVVVKRDTLSLASMVGHQGAFVVDSLGVVIMSQNPGLLLEALDGAKVFQLTPQERAARYRSDILPRLHIHPWDPVDAPQLQRIDEDAVPQVLVKRHMDLEKLDVYVAQRVPEVEVLLRERDFNFAMLAVAGAGAIALVAAGLGGWRSRRSVLVAIERLGHANRKLSVEVAERQRTEVLLRESREYLVVHEARLRALLRSLPEQVWMKDRAGAYLAVNVEFERFQGTREADVLGKSDHDMGWKRAAYYAEQDQATLAAAEPLVFHETEHSAEGGGTRQLEVTKTAVRDDRGEVIGVVGIARDMTEIQAANLALKSSEARFRATFETAGDAILIIRHAVVIDCNRRAAELLGAEGRGGLLGRSMALFAPGTQPDGESSTRMAGVHLADIKRGGMKTFEWRCRRLDGSEFDAEITISLFQHNGHKLLQAVLRDVSERRRMIAALEAAKEDAERANRSKSVFLANMSHEIRTPLNAVLGFTQLLMADRKLPDETQSRLRVIHGAGNRLLGLINDVLDLAKIESGSLQVLSAPFDLMQELRDVDALYGTHARAKGLTLQSELSLSVPTVVEGDRNKLGQIVSNLLGNALKFTERGHIGLHVWRDSEHADRVWFEVHDTGPGIADADLADLFVPFRQGAAGQEKGGTGLGLGLSRDLARAMGGELTVSSTPGHGTQVRFWLPLPTSRLSASGAPVGAGAQVLDPATPCTVLVIEDDPDSRDVLVNLLREVGCTVMQAFDGIEGLARCRSERFDIVFSDIRMPHMDGVELIERLRADPFTAALPVVAVSASSLEHERRFYIGKGFQDFIGKPYPFQQVYRALVDYAGVRLRLVEVPTEATEAGQPLTPLAAGAARRVREQLRALATAAASGQLGAVARLMEALAPEDIGSERWRAFDEAAQAYDFQLLEERVAAVIAQLDATPAAAPAAPG
ncbi:ATP-binding protein [Scleromatobacter humisilvae]|uniref:histidine kinase n=1 Tax=Scleromatobacter humisilvae TaxID=2897159 RepID=A0A9X1YFB8_9BURK|nr:ATP-binding protein [Scleromatobacter humisilvae]MCK9685464.1 PAS domain S-box protein [Scleromatobacter humisilvae]